MSLILDALNKSDGERPERDTGPGLQARHEPGGEIPGTPWRRWVLPAGVLVLLITVIVAWLWEPAERPPQAQSTQSAAASVPPLHQPEQAENPGSSQQEIMAQRKVLRDLAVQAAARQAAANTESRSQTMSADVAALYAGKPAARSTPGISAPAETLAGAPATRVVEPGSIAVVEPVPLAPAAPLDVHAITEAAQLALTERPIIEHAVPTIDRLSQRTKDEIPSIFFSKHSWSSNPQELSVVLNGEVHREGDTIKPGLRLVEILQDSILLDYQGTEFRLRSLNSWVNL